MAARCVTLWIGDELGAVERACLRSVLRQGHELALYCYHEPAGVPEGVDLQPAAEVLPQDCVFRHRSGSYGMFSDWFRYELLRRGAGTWVDTDVYLLQPLDTESAYLFGEQATAEINNAVLRLPPGSPLLDDLLRPFTRGKAPLGLSLRDRARQWLDGGLNLERLPWGSTGPNALTRAAARRGLTVEALPPPVLYPVPWQKALWIVDPTVSLDDVRRPDTVAVHLWNECIKGVKDTAGPEGSFLNRLQREGRE